MSKRPVVDRHVEGCPAGVVPADTPAAGQAAKARALEVLEVVPAVMDFIRCAMRDHVGEHLSIPQFRCLNFVARTPGCSIGAAAAFLDVTMPTASAMIDRLVRAGAVTNNADATDRRRSRVTLTSAGRSQLRSIRLGVRNVVAATLLACSDDELREVEAGLAVLQRIFLTDRQKT